MTFFCFFFFLFFLFIIFLFWILLFIFFVHFSGSTGPHDPPQWAHGEMCFFISCVTTKRTFEIVSKVQHLCRIAGWALPARQRPLHNEIERLYFQHGHGLYKDTQIQDVDGSLPTRTHFSTRSATATACHCSQHTVLLQYISFSASSLFARSMDCVDNIDIRTYQCYCIYVPYQIYKAFYGGEERPKSERV